MHDCTSEARNSLEVKVDGLGLVTLFLCNHCLDEFKDDDTTKSHPIQRNKRD